jgi:hypothetical protein
MELRSLHLIGKESLDKCLDRRVVQVARTVETDETRSLDLTCIA